MFSDPLVVDGWKGQNEDKAASESRSEFLLEVLITC